ncbi:putative O-methyltransferase [Lindgomyces ingoldianus]|uniref:O-methyltransferase n=1 Tax=Lindgomyces ingoldianus TaxID=673940 RepID=A0ACB6QBR1_9PLEO|nr:putative O-methyltransferase [Lindgomyces ingoldianus]KAF2464342.1 putative O-methyltransferase [Lindgomyces ingoldianus]
MPNSRIVQLAQMIATRTSVLDEHIQNNNLSQPAFEPGSPTEPIQQTTPEIEKARTDVIEAAIELRQLLEGPVRLLLPESNFSPLAAIYNFKVASFVPLGCSISFVELADKCGLSEHDLGRIIRYVAAHHRVFCEPEKGYVAHTAASKLLSENKMIEHLMGLTFAECWPAHSRVIDAIARKSEEPNISGYAFANGTSLNTFDFLSHHPERAHRFAGAMSSTSQASLDALSNYFGWAGLEAGTTVVDLGGGQGHVSVHLARTFTHLHFVVQDMAAVVDGMGEKIPEDVQDRVKITAHDMFTKQPIKGAGVYLLRYILHDWPDKYCVEVLRHLTAAMKKGAKVVVQDHLLPEPGTLPLLQEMQIRSMDAIMLSLFNSREREVDDWQNLFNQADGRFGGFRATRVKENPSTGIIVAEWTGE